MTNRRMLAVIRSSMERSILDKKPQDAAQGMFALVLVQKDLIKELEKELTSMKLNQRYGKGKAA